MSRQHREDPPIAKRTARTRATAAPSQPGRHEQSGQTFSPLTVSSSPKQEPTTPDQVRAVPIGRPVPDDLYEQMKKKAETEPPARSAPKGQQDQSAPP